jgi:hypothetical protein
MISEHKFANSYSSFWNQLLPIADSFLRHLNLASERFATPITSSLPIDRDRRSVVNELGFRLFRERTITGSLSEEKVTSIERAVREYIERLVPSISKLASLTKEERTEADKIAKSLASYFYKPDLSKIIFWPQFKGCGQLGACKADMICKSKLVEVKAGDRQFRVTDIRQIITYLALNFSSQQYQLANIVLVNPRTGKEYECTVETLIESCSGRKPVDVFSDIIDFVSAEEISK